MLIMMIVPAWTHASPIGQTVAIFYSKQIRASWHLATLKTRQATLGCLRSHGATLRNFTYRYTAFIISLRLSLSYRIKSGKLT
jgi:hypothetical protein